MLVWTTACSAPRGAVPQPAAGAAAGSTSSTVDPAAPATSAEGLVIEGQLSTGYRARWTDGASDQDAYASLLLDAGDASGSGWYAHLNATLTADIDQRSDPAEPQDFFGLDDTYDHDPQLHAYEAWAAIEELGPIADLRLGRQQEVLTPELAWYDGGRVVARPGGKAQLELGLYGGLPVHRYDSSSSGDLLLGAWAEALPWGGARARMDWMHIEDEQLLGSESDDLLGLSLDQSLSRPLRMELAYTRLEDEDRDARATLVWTQAEHDLVLRVSRYQLLSPQQQLTLELDPFTSALQTLEPFGQTLLMASKGIGERLFVEAGFDLRRVSDPGDVGPSNREFERAFLTGTLLELPPLELTLALTGDVWQSDQDEIRSWGFDLSRSFSGRADLSLGSSYALYKFDVLQGVELNHVRTWYARLRLRRGAGVDVHVRCEIEETDEVDYGSLKIGSTWRI